MSPELSTAIALLLYTAGLLPFAWMALRPGGSRGIAILAGVAMLALAMFQTGAFSRGSLTSPDVSRQQGARTPESRCREIMDILIENRVVMAQPTSEGLIVRGGAWDQLPLPVRDAVTTCAQTMADGDGDGEIPLIRR